MAQGFIHYMVKSDATTAQYVIICGTIMDNIDAAVTNFRFVTCGWCQDKLRLSAHRLVEGMKTLAASPAIDEYMKAIE